MEHLPIDIVLIRHGESEGNLAQSRSKKGSTLFSENINISTT
jgi:broad specificity phosphatase PhoE